jgi:hypothetical protein
MKDSSFIINNFTCPFRNSSTTYMKNKHLDNSISPIMYCDAHTQPCGISIEFANFSENHSDIIIDTIVQISSTNFKNKITPHLNHLTLSLPSFS